jgi:hypothetical protein
MHVPPAGGPPPHRHDFEETFIILEGELDVTFRGNKSVVRPGDTVNIPSNAPHQFHNSSSKPVRLLCICSPAGQESFFMQVGIPVATRTTPPPDLDKAGQESFAAKAKEKSNIGTDPKNPKRAILTVGNDDFPVPIPIVKEKGKWIFDMKAGRQEILNRRIGTNELDAITICRGFVAAQEEYAQEKHDDSKVNQYAQRIISTEGKHDGLAWRDPDGAWSGPVLAFQCRHGRLTHRDKVCQKSVPLPIIPWLGAGRTFYDGRSPAINVVTPPQGRFRSQGPKRSNRAPPVPA